MREWLRFLTRAGWGMVDQALSSLTNFALSILVARDFSTADLGLFGLVFTSYLVALNVARPSSIEPLLIRFSRVDHDAWAAATAATTGLSLLIGLLGGTICLAVWAIAGGTLGASFLALGVMMPGLLVQDAWRFAFFAAGKGRSAALNDCAWAVVLLPMLAIVLWVSAPTIPLLVGAWGLAATAAAVLGVKQSGVWPDPRLARAWLHEHRDLNRPLTVDMMVSLTGSQLTTFSIAALGGLAVAGTLRAAQLLLGPLLMLFQGAMLIAVPEGSRLSARSPQALWRGCIAFAVGLACLALAGGLFVFLLPDSIGVAILRQNWTASHAIILALACAYAVSWAGTAATTGLRVLAEGRRLVRITSIAAATTLVAATVGAAMAAALGAVFGMAVGGLVEILLAWLALRSVIRHASVMRQGKGPDGNVRKNAG